MANLYKEVSALDVMPNKLVHHQIHFTQMLELLVKHKLVHQTKSVIQLDNVKHANNVKILIKPKHIAFQLHALIDNTSQSFKIQGSVELIHADVQLAQTMNFQTQTEDHAQELAAQMIHILLYREVVNNAQDIQDPHKHQAAFLAKTSNVDSVSILISMLNVLLAQLTKLLTMNVQDVFHHNVEIDKLYYQMVHLKNAKLIQEQLEPTLLNNVELVDQIFATAINILVLMVDATTVENISFQTLEIIIEIDVLLQLAHKIPLLTDKDNAKHANQASTQIRPKEIVSK